MTLRAGDGMSEPEQDIYGPNHDDDSPSEEWVAGYIAGSESRLIEQAAAPDGLDVERLARAMANAHAPAGLITDWSALAATYAVITPAAAATPSHPATSETVESGMVEGLLEDAERDQGLVAEWNGPGVLDRAWSEAVAALPEGWSLDLEYEPFVRVIDPYSATAWDPEVNPGETGTGPTPTAALQALTAALKETR